MQLDNNNIRDLHVLTLTVDNKSYTLLTNANGATIKEAVNFSKEFDTDQHEYIKMYLTNKGCLANFTLNTQSIVF